MYSALLDEEPRGRVQVTTQVPLSCREHNATPGLPGTTCMYTPTHATQRSRTCAIHVPEPPWPACTTIKQHGCIHGPNCLPSRVQGSPEQPHAHHISQCPAHMFRPVRVRVCSFSFTVHRAHRSVCRYQTHRPAAPPLTRARGTPGSLRLSGGSELRCSGVSQTRQPTAKQISLSRAGVAPATLVRVATARAAVPHAHCPSQLRDGGAHAVTLQDTLLAGATDATQAVVQRKPCLFSVGAGHGTRARRWAQPRGAAQTILNTSGGVRR